MSGLPRAAPPGPGRQEDAGWSADARWRRRGAPARLALTRSGAAPRLRYAAGERLRESGEFTVGILAADQQPVLAAAREMVKASSREVDKFAGYGLHTLP